MRGYFLLFDQKDILKGKNKSGIGLKIKNQINTFNNAGLNCVELIMPSAFKNSFFKALYYRVPYSNYYPHWTYLPEFDNADYIYMRRPGVMNYHMRRIFKKIREKNPEIKIVVEIPTYPYDKEYGSKLDDYLLLLKDKYNRTKMKGLIDRFAVPIEEDEIWGLPTIKIRNGIDVDAIHKRRPVHTKKGENCIHLCAIAMFSKWHGYERLIEGLKNYYSSGGTRLLHCHFVGEGFELQRYKDLVMKYQLEKYVDFYGYMDQDELDDIYNISRISVGSLGMYKIDLNISYTLKSREAVARGIPMITGCATDIFKEGEYKYFLEFPNDDSPLDIKRIIEFHDNIYVDDEYWVIDRIRDYALENVSMEKAMEPVINFLKHSENAEGHR